MRSTTAVFLTLFFAVTSHGEPDVTAHLPHTALEKLLAFSEARNRGDCETLLQLSSPEILTRLDQDSQQRDAYCRFIEDIAARGYVDIPGEVIEVRAEGPYRVAIVKTLRQSETAQTDLVGAEALYVLHSDDSGRSWWVVDNACIDRKWMSILYPPWDGNSPIGFLNANADELSGTELNR